MEYDTKSEIRQQHNIKFAAKQNFSWSIYFYLETENINM